METIKFGEGCPKCPKCGKGKMKPAADTEGGNISITNRLKCDNENCGYEYEKGKEVEI